MVATNETKVPAVIEPSRARSSAKKIMNAIASAISSCVTGTVIELVTLMRIALPRSRSTVRPKLERASDSPP